MTIFPKEFYTPSTINGDTALALNAKMPYLSSLSTVKKSQFSLLDRIKIWLGIHNTCIEKISKLFAASVKDIADPEKYSNSFLEKIITTEKGIPGAERLETLAANLLAFNAQVDKHNQSLSWKTPFRKTAEKINDKFIHELYLQANVLRTPPPPPPPPPTPVEAAPIPEETRPRQRLNCNQRFMNLLWKIPQYLIGSHKKTDEAAVNPSKETSASGMASDTPEPAISTTPKTYKIFSPSAPVIGASTLSTESFNPAIPVNAPINPPALTPKTNDFIKKYAAPNTNPPSSIPHLTNTCHFATSINFLASLPTMLDIFDKSVVSGKAKTFKEKLMKILINQATGSGINDIAEYQSLANASRIGTMANENINDMQCASSDIDHFIDQFAPIPTKGNQISSDQQDQLNRYTTTIRHNITFGHTEHGVKESYQIEGVVPYTSNEKIHEISLTSSELIEGKPFTIQNSQKPEAFLRVNSAKFINGEPTEIFENLNECLKDCLKDTWVEPFRTVVKTKATATQPSTCYVVRGLPFYSHKTIATAPEVLMIRLNRDCGIDATGDVRKISDRIEVPSTLIIAGKQYVLSSGAYHGGAHYSAMQKRKNKWFINDDIAGVSEFGVQEKLNYGFLYGYIRKDIHDRMMNI